jgi:tetratricopeptide (TPR) repeat protein
VGAVTGRLLIEIDMDSRIRVSDGLGGERPSSASERASLAWPLGDDVPEELRWYLEDFLRAPYGVYSDRAAQVESNLANWGEALFDSVFAAAPARAVCDAVRSRGQAFELVIQSPSPKWLALPWELIRDPAQTTPLALGGVSVSRSLSAPWTPPEQSVGGSRLRVLMIISRPAGQSDVGYRMIGRPLLERLAAVRGTVEMVVLRPPTLDHLREVLDQAQHSGEPFQIVHFDGHGLVTDDADDQASGALVFELPTGGADYVSAATVAAVIAAARIPVVVLNACQSGAMGRRLEATVATRILNEGAVAVVAMAFAVYAVAAAEFMAAFYERLFAGDSVAEAVSTGRRRLAEHDRRPSPRGPLPLADWIVPVLYARGEVRFPGLWIEGAADAFEEALDELREHLPSRDDPTLAPIGDFIGRDSLFSALEAASRSNRVVVLHGPAGSGKSEFAKAFGRWWADTGGVSRPEHVVWRSFQPPVASFGVDAVIADIGLRLHGADFARLEPAVRRDVVLRNLRTERLLLICDNFESVHTIPDTAGAREPDMDELRLFLEQVASTASTVVITSRTDETWIGEASRIPVSGLATHEAVEFADRLLSPYPQAGPRRAKLAFLDLMNRLGGHPLSMRLILPHMADVEPDMLLAGLRGVVPLPEVNDDGISGPLIANIAYSYNHLTPAAHRLLPALSLLHDIAHVRILETFSNAPNIPERFRRSKEETWEHTLAQATRYGLLTARSDGLSYWIHPALAAYLTARWRHEDGADFDADRGAAEREMLNAYVRAGIWLEEQITTGNAAYALSFVEAHRATLTALFGYALDHGLWDEAGAIAQPLVSYWRSRGLTDEVTTWVDRARLVLEGPDGTPPDLETPAGFLWLFLVSASASRLVDAHQFDAAEQLYLTIQGLLSQRPDSPWHRRRLAITSHQLGTIARRQHRLDSAEDWLGRAVSLAEELGEHDFLAAGYLELGLLAEANGRYADAEDWYNRSLELNQDLGDRPGEASAYHALGSLIKQFGHLRPAQDFLRKALAIRRELGDLSESAALYHGIGMIAEQLEQFDHAEEYYRRALTINEELGNWPDVAPTYHQLGVIAMRRARLDEAGAWFRRAVSIAEDLEAEDGAADGYLNLGSVLSLQGRADEAEDCYMRALTIRQALGNRAGLLLVYAQLSVFAQEHGRLVEAMEWLVRCAAMYEEPPPDPLPALLAQLTVRLGIETLEQCWAQHTGAALPDHIRALADTAIKKAKQMTDPVEHIAQAAATALADLGPGVAFDVDLALDKRASAQLGERYLDPVSVGGLIVSVATLAWTIYNDRQAQTNRLTAETVLQLVRVQISDGGPLDPAIRERIVETVVGEAARATAIDAADTTPEDDSSSLEAAAEG